MSKKTIKIKYIDFWPDLKPEEFLFTKLLQKHFNVQICEDADYVFYSIFGESHWMVPHECVKIFFTGENFCPDFNACDYGIGFEWMQYEDRYVRLPLYLLYGEALLRKAETKHLLPEDFSISENKPDFCSFVVSNPVNPLRLEAFRKLSTYKLVNSGGRYMNNIGGPVADKFTFESRHKFSLCFENGAHSGYTTEKIVEAFGARTIPIYWGDPNINKIFNSKSFINAADFESLDKMVEYVIKVDKDDDLYFKILGQPAFNPQTPNYTEAIEQFETWLVDIFSQPVEKSYRRPRYMHVNWYIDRRRGDINTHGLLPRLSAAKNKLKKIFRL